MESVQTPNLVKLPTVYPLTLPSSGEKVYLRKMVQRDRIIAGAKFDPDKKTEQYGAELNRVCTLKESSITRDVPYGDPYFTADEWLDLDVEDMVYLSHACMKLNKIGEYKTEYKFDF